MNEQQGRLDAAVACPGLCYGLNAGNLEVQRFEGEYREEVQRLPARSELTDATALRGLLTAEREDTRADVRIEFGLVRIAVVPVVLVDPPVVAQADHQVAVQVAGQLVCLTAAKHLSVAGLVAGEGELGRDDGEVDGDQQHPPGVVGQIEREAGRGHHHDIERDPHPVVELAALEQPGVLHDPRQHRVLAASPDGDVHGLSSHGDSVPGARAEVFATGSGWRGWWSRSHCSAFEVSHGRGRLRPEPLGVKRACQSAAA